ncbi:MAG: 1-acyl-sn-glycerol-3-phosphate acyltransferase [Acidobacteriota bacterium]|jgi:1-acyl-sn-glycerol-3-phosphate acyltransferase|nr:1-acyl-sn-glycerol-3-phosphate acyltransferase [Acidobacteriota bacterium]
MHRKRKAHVPPRSRLVFGLARRFGIMGFRLWCRPHIEFNPELKKLAEGNAVFLYAALHKSLWETTGIQVALTLSGMDVPWVGMGDNLVRGRFFQAIVERAGGFLIRRPRGRRDLIVSARQLRDSVLSLLETRRSVLVFPEGTRRGIPDHHCHGPFFPAVFAAVLEYARDLADHGDSGKPAVFIVPVNVDYAKVREDREMIRRRNGPLTLHLLDSLKMIRHIGDVYVSFGAPMNVSELIHLDRRELAEQVRTACLELVKVLPVNVVAHGVLRAEREGSMESCRVHRGIRSVLVDLKPHAHRLRGMSLEDEPAELIRRVALFNPLFQKFTHSMLPVARLYADYIAQFLPLADGMEQKIEELKS